MSGFAACCWLAAAAMFVIVFWLGVFSLVGVLS